MFHVKHDLGGKCSSVLSPPLGGNKRGGCTSGMKYDVKHEEKVIILLFTLSYK